MKHINTRRLNQKLFQPISRVFLLRQLWIVNYYIKSLSNNLRMKTETLVLPKKWYFKNSSFWHFNSLFFFLKTTETPVFNTEIIWLSFEKIINVVERLLKRGNFFFQLRIKEIVSRSIYWDNNLSFSTSKHNGLESI